MAGGEPKDFRNSTPSIICCGVSVTRLDFTMDSKWKIHQCDENIIRYSWNKKEN